MSNEFDIKGVIDESQLEPVQTANGRVVVYLPEFDIFILRGAIDWFAKAIHTYDAAFSNASTGYRTWSTSVLYQSSMFAMQAIVGFLGYAVCSDGGKRYIIRADLTRASDRETYPEWLNRRNDGYRDIVCLNERFLKHTTLWKLFKRVVVQTKNLPSAEAVDELIEHYGSGQFIPERHKLHYNQQYWIFDDWLGQWRTKPGLNVEKSLSETLARADEDVSYGRVVKYSSSLLMCLLEISKALADISAQYTVGMHDLMEYAQSVADEHKLNVLSEITLKD